MEGEPGGAGEVPVWFPFCVQTACGSTAGSQRWDLSVHHALASLEESVPVLMGITYLLIGLQSATQVLIGCTCMQKVALCWQKRMKPQKPTTSNPVSFGYRPVWHFWRQTPYSQHLHFSLAMLPFSSWSFQDFLSTIFQCQGLLAGNHSKWGVSQQSHHLQTSPCILQL